MGWQGKSVTPHKSSVRAAQRILDSLSAGDSVALIDARDHARVIIESPTSDFGLVRKELSRIPPPSGTSNLAEATRKAVQILSRTSNLSREIIVISDGQALGWRPDDKGLWAQYDDQLDLPSIRPRTWVLNIGEMKASENYAVDKITLSREVTAVGYPVRIKTKIRHFGKTPITRRVYLELDGQRLAGQDADQSLPATRGARRASSSSTSFRPPARTASALCWMTTNSPATTAPTQPSP